MNSTSLAQLADIGRTRVRAPGAPVAEIRDLRISLERRGRRSEILHGIDLDVRPREILGIVGESGSGKSVLCMSMLGLLPASSAPQISGTLRVDGVDMLTATPQQIRAARRRDLGVVFQDPMTSLNPTMTVGRQISERSGDPEYSIRLMRSVGIPQPEQRYRAYPHELSGGLRQRVMIAMALAHDPSLMIADEPTTALDVTVQAQVLSLLAAQRDEIGCSLVMVTHDLGVAAQIADRIAVMHHGHLVEVGPSEQVLHDPQDEYTKELLASRLSIPAAVPDESRDEGGSDSSPPPGKAPILSVAELHCSFRVKDDRGRRTQLHALRGITLDVAPGEAISIVGESGSGKSTLLRCIGGLESRYSGTRRGPTGTDVQMVFQDAGSSLTPWMTMQEILEERLPRRMPREERRERLRAALERVGLPEEVLQARSSELSGGQRQRIALARATIVPAKVLLCDEPTSALDASVAASVLELIGELRRELDIAVLFVTHDLAVAHAIGDRIAVMYLGRIVEIGDADSIVHAARHPYTRNLLASMPHEGALETPLTGEPASPLDPPSGCSFHPRCPVAREECSSTVTGIQLIPVEPRIARLRPRHAVACVRREEQP